MAVIESAYGNADHLECPEPDELVLAECRVDGAPMFKRIQPRARGTAFQIKRRMAHIIVSLVDPEDLVKETPEELTTTTQETEGSPSTPETPALPPGS